MQARVRIEFYYAPSWRQAHSLAFQPEFGGLRWAGLV